MMMLSFLFYEGNDGEGISLRSESERIYDQHKNFLSLGVLLTYFLQKLATIN